MLAMVVFACATSGTVGKIICERNYQIGVIKSTNVGDAMIHRHYRGELSHPWSDPFGELQGTTSVELIYGGVAKNVIKVLYREYSNNLARPAFSQELQYDLDESKIIVFRNTKIEISEATNNKLTFKVVETPEPQFTPKGIPIIYR